MLRRYGILCPTGITRLVYDCVYSKNRPKDLFAVRWQKDRGALLRQSNAERENHETIPRPPNSLHGSPSLLWSENCFSPCLNFSVSSDVCVQPDTINLFSHSLLKVSAVCFLFFSLSVLTKKKKKKIWFGNQNLVKYSGQCGNLEGSSAYIQGSDLSLGVGELLEWGQKKKCIFIYSEILNTSRTEGNILRYLEVLSTFPAKTFSCNNIKTKTMILVPHWWSG